MTDTDILINPEADTDMVLANTDMIETDTDILVLVSVLAKKSPNRYISLSLYAWPSPHIK